MKTLLTALAATLVAAPLAATAAQAAPQRHETSVVRHGPNRTVVTERTVIRHHDWRRGDRFDPRQAANYRVVSDWRAQRLAAPPRGHRWVRSGRDVVLISDGGTVVRVVQHRY